MRITELKPLLKNAKKEHLTEAVTELYKLLPKAQKTSVLDQALKDLLAGNKTISLTKTKDVIADFNQLEQEIHTFIELARAYCYVFPNRLVPKATRSKWRFKIKQYIKILDNVSAQDANYPRAMTLLEDIYKILCEGWSRNLFPTEDPFRAVGWDPIDLLQLVVKKNLAQGYSRKNLLRAITNTIFWAGKCHTIYEYEIIALISELKTSDLKYSIIDLAKEEIANITLTRPKRGAPEREKQTFRNNASLVANYCAIILAAHIQLGEYQAGVEYFFQHVCNDYSSDNKLEAAISVIEALDASVQIWKYTYDYAVQHGLKPRPMTENTHALIEAGLIADRTQ